MDRLSKTCLLLIVALLAVISLRSFFAPQSAEAAHHYKYMVATVRNGREVGKTLPGLLSPRLARQILHKRVGICHGHNRRAIYLPKVMICRRSSLLVKGNLDARLRKCYRRSWNREIWALILSRSSLGNPQEYQRLRNCSIVAGPCPA